MLKVLINFSANVSEIFSRFIFPVLQFVYNGGI